MCVYKLEVDEEYETDEVNENFVTCLECGDECYVPGHVGECYMCDKCLRTW